MNFTFFKFRYSSTWTVFCNNDRIGLVAAYIDDNDKRRGFYAMVRTHDADGNITGYRQIGAGYKTRTAAAKAIVSSTAEVA